MNYIAAAVYEICNENFDLTFRILFGLIVKFKLIYGQQDLTSVQTLCFQLQCFMQVNIPKVYAKMKHLHGIDVELITLPWLITLFTTDFNQGPILAASRRHEFLFTTLSLLSLDGTKALIKISMCLLNYEPSGNIRQRS